MRTNRQAIHPTYVRILDAARSLFAERGYRATSMRQIAARVGITDPGLYYHFASKREILTALLDEAPRARSEPAATTVPELVDQICDLFQSYSRDAEISRIALRAQLGHEPDALAFRERRLGHLRAALRPSVEALFGAASGDRLRAVEYLLFGMLWDGVITYGSEWPTIAGQHAFQDRSRRLFSLILRQHGAERDHSWGTT